MSETSFVETTLPPGYCGYAAYWSWGVMYGFSTGPVTRERWITEADRNRAAWRHWTAAVLRGRGDVRARSYLESGGIDWRHPDTDDDCEVPIAWCGRAVITFDRDGRFAVGDEDHWYREEMRACDDIDEAMARFAALVLATEGMP